MSAVAMLRLICRCRALALTSLLGIGLAYGADTAPDKQDIQSLESQISASSELSDAARDSLIEELSQARQRLKVLQIQANELEVIQGEATAFDVDARKLQKQILELTTSSPVEVPTQRDESALSAETAQRELSVQQLRRGLVETREHEAWLSRRADEIAQEIAAAAERFHQSGQLSGTAATNWQLDSLGDSGGSITARVKALVDRIDAHVAAERVNVLQQELTTLAPRQTLASIRARAMQLQLQTQMQSLDQYWSLLNQIRSESVQTRLAELTKKLNTSAEGASPRVPTVDERVRWATAELSLLEQELAVVRRTAQMTESMMEVYQIRQLLIQINSTGSLNDSLAGMIRTLRQALPDLTSLSAERQALQTRQRSLQVDRILWESVLRGDRSDTSLTSIGAADSAMGSDVTLQAMVTLLSVANRVSDRMISLETTLIEVQTRTDEVASTLDGSVLWLRSNESLTLSWITNGYSGLRFLSSPESWRGIGNTLISRARATPLPLLVLILGLLVTIAIRPRLTRLLTLSATGVGNVGEDRYWSTPAAIGASLLWALPAPLVLWLLHWVLKDGFFVSGSLVPALSGALWATAMVLAVLLFFKVLCRPDGIFRRHFEWDEHAIDRLHRHLKWFVWVCALGTAVFTLAMLSGRTDLRYGLAAMAFLVVSMAMSALLYVCLRPGRGVAFELTHSTVQSPLSSMGIWVLIAVPAFVGLLPLAGYFDIAVEIQNRAFSSGVYLMITALLVGLALREFTVAHRRMSLRKARARRAAREAERNAQLNAPISGDAAPDLSFAWDDDHQRIARQAQQLLKFAGIALFVFFAWMVWKPLFPALDVFNDIVLWRASGAVGSTLGDQAITLGKLLFALGVIILGVVGSRNLRGLLEIVVFERLNLDQGARYAINAIASYTLIGTTLLIGIAQLGVDWSRLQWIVAALGVGLGFGLQEIVANFISGLIILFERPVRVGDTVTIGGLSGTVSNIQIRATTLTDFDNRDVLLPNKSIITENVTNWTLHDAVTRILLTIGVAYGSDIDQVRALLVECLNTTDDVLNSPESTVFFISHGDSSLNFEIRAFVATPAHRLPVTHALNVGINKCLAAHEIEIPFPQRVVHMRNEPEVAEQGNQTSTL